MSRAYSRAFGHTRSFLWSPGLCLGNPFIRGPSVSEQGDPFIKPSASHGTHKCSVGSTSWCWSFPFGMLWSMTIVSVFAKQKPLDLMISANQSSR